MNIKQPYVIIPTLTIISAFILRYFVGWDTSTLAIMGIGYALGGWSMDKPNKEKG